MTDKSKDWASLQEDMTDLEPSSDNDVEGASIEDDIESPISGVLEHPSYKALETQLTNAEQKIHETRQEALRAMAELENVRRRAERDVENAYKYGLEKFVRELLQVADSLEHAANACDSGNGDIAVLKEGVDLTTKLMQDTLQKFNVQLINPVDEMFDPNRHEAISMQDVAGKANNSIVAVVQKGYSLNERVIRPARVIIAKSSS